MGDRPAFSINIGAGIVLALFIVIGILFLSSAQREAAIRKECQDINGTYKLYFVRNTQSGAARTGFFCRKWDFYYSWNGSAWAIDPMFKPVI